jgi:hypothetical protein
MQYSEREPKECHNIDVLGHKSVEVGIERRSTLCLPDFEAGQQPAKQVPPREISMSRVPERQTEDRYHDGVRQGYVVPGHWQDEGISFLLEIQVRES